MKFEWGVDLTAWCVGVGYDPYVVYGANDYRNILAFSLLCFHFNFIWRAK